MNRACIKKYAIVLIVIVMSVFSESKAQFYNGHQMQFGKNRVQYEKDNILESYFYWSFLRFDRYDLYFHTKGQELAEYAGKFIYEELAEVEDFFEYSLNKRIIFILYNKLSDYRQSNIGLVTGKDQTNVGGVTKIIDNKVFLYFDGDHKKFEEQIRAAIAEVILTEMLYGSSMRDKVTNNTLMNLPEWYIQGLLSYVSTPWNTEIENRVRDAFNNDRYKKFNRLRGEEAKYAGHSLWYFVSETYGKSIIPSIIYFTRINKKPSSGFMNVLGVSLNGLAYEWEYFYKERFDKDGADRMIDHEQQFSLKNKNDKRYLQLNMSPDGRYLAYTSNEKGQYKIYIHDFDTGKTNRILKREHKMDQIVDYSYPVLEWNPGSRVLTWIVEEKGELVLYFYFVDTGKKEKEVLQYFDKILDYSFSPDGLKIVLSGLAKGKIDIFVHTLASNSNERITNDWFDDLQPRFIEGGTKIIFNSDRLTTGLEYPDSLQLERAHSHNIYIYDYQNKKEELTSLTDAVYANYKDALELSDKKYLFLGDESGIVNKYQAAYDSTISFIDTISHYRYFTEISALSNYPVNILEHDKAVDGKYAGLFFKDGNYSIQTEYLEDLSMQANPQKTSFGEERIKDLLMEDSLKVMEAREEERREKLRKELAEMQRQAAENPVTDTIIDINNYRFENEKNKAGLGYAQEYLNAKPGFKLPKIRPYETAFYTNYIVNQIDYGFLNASYQPFTGGPYYFNPGLNALFKIGTMDLFEDYKITAGVRFSGNFDSNEYLISFEDLSKRMDKELIFHRQVLEATTTQSLLKTSTHELMYVLKYPFSQVSSLRATFSLRNDRNVFLATDWINMAEDDRYLNWGGLKLEYVFDNTLSRGVNLYNGIRGKVFGEFYGTLDRSFTDLWVVGFDFRHYLPIHRDLIWANRVAASTSFGSSRLIYYMGSVDNWINLSQNVKTFDQSVPIDTSQVFAYQAVATNMRGFTQNIRNGNSFALINSEIRWPVVKYFANRPLSSDILANLQLIGFFDVGTAWSGKNPRSPENSYYFRTYENGPLTVKVNRIHDPIVAGFGFGIRTRLFGYFVRADWAWGIEDYVVLPRIFYLSLNLDF